MLCAECLYDYPYKCEDLQMDLRGSQSIGEFDEIINKRVARK